MYRLSNGVAVSIAAFLLLFPALAPTQTLVTMDSGYHANPAWSPDGGVASPLTFDTEHEDEPSWSPDDTILSFNRGAQGNRDVWLIVLADSALHQFTTHEADDGTGVWSPYGNTLAFHSNRTGEYHIWVDQTTVPVQLKTWGACKSLFR